MPTDPAAFDDVLNFRDFGDVASVLGHVRPGLLYRSGHCGNISPGTRARLEAMRFGVVADLRYAKERLEAPSDWPGPDHADLFLVDGGLHSDGPHVAVLRAGNLGIDAIDRFYIHFYRQIPFEPLYRPLFGRILVRMAASDRPALIQCTVGKDRTGVLAALVLHILGVGQDAIMADYMRTRDAPGLGQLVPEIVARLRDRLGHPVRTEVAHRMLGVQEDYLRAAFAAIRDRAGSIDAYLEGIGVTKAVVASLRDHLLGDDPPAAR